MTANDKMMTYVERLTGSQSRLYAYVYSLCGDPHQAADILQETNKKLWELHEEYDTDRDFLPWAMKVAYNQVRAARSRSSRERLVFQEDETLEALHQDQQEQVGFDERTIALESCLRRLKPQDRKLIDRHYTKGETLEAIGKSLQRRANSLAVNLHRLRLALADCIRKATS